jgi:ribosomal protein S27AE
MNLSAEERKHYLNLEKGYHGEVMFDSLTETLQNDVFVLNDLCLKINNSIFQIDTLIISQDKLFPIEVKNYEGDFYYESDRFQTVSKHEIKNPLDQLKRSNSLLRQLLQNIGVHLPIEGYVIFINPEFTLYQSPLNIPIIFPTQLNRFIKKLNQTPSKLNGQHKKLADQLISMHQNVSPYTKFPSYEYGHLKKGIICPACNSFMISIGERKVVCEKCGYEEEAESAILRSVEELKFLFPDKKITTNCVYEWCKVIGSTKKIRRILKENYKMIVVRQWTYFE